jgi:ParB family chromosome partitioning protein
MAGRKIQLGLDALEDLPVVESAPPQTFVSSPAANQATKGEAVETPTDVDLFDVVENPLNRRERFGDIQELADSMRAVGQVQACAAVTREAFLAIYPEHKPAISGASYVLVAGARRRRAAKLNGTRLEIRVNDSWAVTRGRFYAACIAENGPRLNFDPWEEAVAIRELVEELGTNKAAAEQMGISPQVVSQRLSIFRLSEPMQALLRAGDLPIEPARTIAANVEPDQQLEVWMEQRWRESRQVPKPSAATSAPAPARRGRPPRSVRVAWAVDADAALIAKELRKVLDSEVIRALAEQLQSD